MVYWFANLPRQVERFSYDVEQHLAAEQKLTAMIAEIAALDLAQWSLTIDVRKCKYCPYRTLCGRERMEGIEETEQESEDDLFDFDLDLEQIAEIEF